jgi:hypothetical protein
VLSSALSLKAKPTGGTEALSEARVGPQTAECCGDRSDVFRVLELDAVDLMGGGLFRSIGSGSEDG